MYILFYSIYLISFSKDTVVKDIPRYQNGNPSVVYQKKRKVEEKVGLTSLEKGFDSMQIRIWYGTALIDSSQLIELKKEGTKWTGLLYRIEYRYDKKTDSLIACPKRTDEIKPRTGWDDFIRKIFELKILSMRDAIENPHYENYNDGDGMTVEVATKRKYRFYNYHSFRQQKGIWQAVNIEKIMLLLEDEFSFKRVAK